MEFIDANIHWMKSISSPSRNYNFFMTYSILRRKSTNDDERPNVESEINIVSVNGNEIKDLSHSNNREIDAFDHDRKENSVPLTEIEAQAPDFQLLTDSKKEFSEADVIGVIKLEPEAQVVKEKVVGRNKENNSIKLRTRQQSKSKKKSTKASDSTSKHHHRTKNKSEHKSRVETKIKSKGKDKIALRSNHEALIQNVKDLKSKNNHKSNKNKNDCKNKTDHNSKHDVKNKTDHKNRRGDVGKRKVEYDVRKAPELLVQNDEVPAPEAPLVEANEDSERMAVKIKLCFSCDKRHVHELCPLQNAAYTVPDRKWDQQKEKEYKFNDKSDSYAHLSLPPILDIDNSNTAHGPAVFSKCELREFTQFGPLVGTTIKEVDIAEDNSMRHVWEIHNENGNVYISTESAESSNWGRFLRPAGAREERNVAAISRESKLYFVTTKLVNKGEELLYWQDDAFKTNKKKMEKTSNYTAIRFFFMISLG